MNDQLQITIFSVAPATRNIIHVVADDLFEYV